MADVDKISTLKTLYLLAMVPPGDGGAIAQKRQKYGTFIFRYHGPYVLLGP